MPHIDVFGAHSSLLYEGEDVVEGRKVYDKRIRAGLYAAFACNGEIVAEFLPCANAPESPSGENEPIDYPDSAER